MRRTADRAVWVSVILALSLCAGCERVTSANYGKIKDGMSLAEVTAILGDPTETSGIDIGIASGQMASWEGRRAKIVVQLVNDKVIGKQYVTTDD